MGYDTVGLTVSREEAERLEAENARRLLKNRKLSLILDLDQTIVHASWDQRVGDFIKEDTDIRQFNLPGSSVVYYIKLRPGLDHFLKEIEQLYELHIYTMGTRDYAEAVTNEIDPNGSLFKERILSRDESGSVTQKKLQRLFPCDTSMVVVLDDRSDVWSFSANLIRIKPYEFFVGTGDINCPFKKKVTPCSDKIVVAGNHYSDDDNELYKMLNILKDVHKNFYDKDEHDKEADVTHIIPKMKLNVLQHVIITFTDVIPQIKDPTLSWIWQMATSFGATCSMDLTGKTTHLIAVKFSSKVKAAREYGHSIHVVTPAWLLDSTSSWSIQDESNYQLPQEEEIENPEYTLLDLEEEEEKVSLDWEEADREVEDFINESGIDDIWDTDSDTVDSPLYNKSWKRKREQESGGESGGDASEDDNESITLAVRRQQRVNKRQKSQLSKVTTASSSQCTSSNNNSDDDLGSLDDLVDILDEALN
ncbi:HAD-like domain-containing protein [Thamnidium elegans]|nr:HAD-like domain-containing protein [Thamnidium elegans]